MEVELIFKDVCSKVLKATKSPSVSPVDCCVAKQTVNNRASVIDESVINDVSFPRAVDTSDDALVDTVAAPVQFTSLIITTKSPGLEGLESLTSVATPAMAPGSRTVG